MLEVATNLAVAPALDEASTVLREAGVPDPRRAAREILGAVIGCEPSRVWLDRERVLSPADVSDLRSRTVRVAAGEPLAYVTGIQGFRSLVMAVDHRVLIPRPETEGLVGLVLGWARDRWGDGGWGTVADVGTGSGCLALSLAAEGSFSGVVGTDVSADVLDVARVNATGLDVGPCCIEWRHGPMLAPIAGERFDVIVSNPPYVSETEWVALDHGVRDFEPRTALVSAEGGLAHTRELLETAPTVLSPGGLLALEIDARRAHAALSLAQRVGWHEPVVRDDVFGRPRFLLATREWS